jgi:hypothetical protein
MAIATVARQEVFESGEQITLGSRTGFHQRQPGCGMGHKHVDQPVTAFGAEPLELPREVNDPVSGGVDIDLYGSHQLTSLPL